MDFEINFIFLIKLFFQQDQKVITKTYKYLENEKSFQDEIKSIIHHFKGLSNEANNRIFSGRWKSNFNAFVNKYILSGNLKVDVFEEFEDLEPEPSLEEYISERGEDKKNLTHKIKKDKDWRY